jgi:hypothetical protein
VVDYITAPVSDNMSEWHGQTDSYKITGVSMQLLGPWWSTMWMYLTMVQALHLDLHTGAVRMFMSEFSMETYKLNCGTVPQR